MAVQFAAVLVGVGAAGCGGGDAAGVAETGVAAVESELVCQELDLGALLLGSSKGLESLADAGPEPIRSELGVLADAFSRLDARIKSEGLEGDDSLYARVALTSETLGQPSVDGALTRVSAWMVAHCGGAGPTTDPTSTVETTTTTTTDEDAIDEN